MAILTKADILAADDRSLVEIAIPEWGGSVKIRVMSGTERDRFESEFVNGNKTVDNVRAKLVAKCVCSDDGTRLFSEADIPLLGEKSAAVLDTLFASCMKHNKFTKDDVSDLAKNS